MNGSPKPPRAEGHTRRRRSSPTTRPLADGQRGGRKHARVGRALKTVVLACLVGACGSGRASGPGPAADLAPATAAAEFVLTSHYPGPVSVYAKSGASRIRLATLTGWRTVRIPVPRDVVGRGRVVRLMARPIGETRQVITEAFSVEDGDRVLWTVIQPIGSSAVTLRVDLGGR